MALTEHPKRTVVDVSLPNGDPNKVRYEYYDEMEWAAVEAQRAANVLPNARAKRKVEIKEEAQQKVNGVVAPDDILEAQLRMMELLDKKFEFGLDAAEQLEFAGLKAKRADAKGFRKKEQAAYAAIDNAATVEDVAAVVL